MTDGAEGAPPRLARPFVYGFLAVFIACGALSIEWWPFTAFKLFSQLRTGTVSGWQVVTVDGDGDEHVLDFDALPRGFHGWLHVVGRFPSMSEAERVKVMDEWAHAAYERGAEVATLRVYRTRQAVRTDFDEPPPRVERTLGYELVAGLFR